MGINRASQAAKYLGPRLGLIQNHELMAASQSWPLQVETQAILLLFQIEVDSAKGPGQRRLATLARPDQRDRGGLAKTRLDERTNTTREHACKLTLNW
jgi:hypothetical protein